MTAVGARSVGGTAGFSVRLNLVFSLEHFSSRDRIYRDAAEVAIAFGELKTPGSSRPDRAADVAEEEPPSRRGGRAAATEAVSAAAIAKILGGIDFPKSKAELREYARRNQERVANPAAVLAVIDRLPERRYESMKDVEIEVGKVL